MMVRIVHKSYNNAGLMNKEQHCVVSVRRFIVDKEGDVRYDIGLRDFCLIVIFRGFMLNERRMREERTVTAVKADVFTVVAVVFFLLSLHIPIIRAILTILILMTMIHRKILQMMHGMILATGTMHTITGMIINLMPDKDIWERKKLG